MDNISQNLQANIFHSIDYVSSVLSSTTRWCSKQNFGVNIWKLVATPPSQLRELGPVFFICVASFTPLVFYWDSFMGKDTLFQSMEWLDCATWSVNEDGWYSETDSIESTDDIHSLFVHEIYLLVIFYLYCPCTEITFLIVNPPMGMLYDWKQPNIDGGTKPRKL